MRPTLVVLFAFAALVAMACGPGAPREATVTPAATTSATSATAASGTVQPAPAGSVSPAPTPFATVTPSATPAATPTPPQAGATGIEGLVTVGPTCPVERPESPCPDRPLAARITIWRGDTQVAEIRSGDDGRFLVLLRPGDYRIVGETEGTFPRGTTVEVTVAAGRLTQVLLQYDSGIR